MNSSIGEDEHHLTIIRNLLNGLKVASGWSCFKIIIFTSKDIAFFLSYFLIPLGILR